MNKTIKGRGRGSDMHARRAVVYSARVVWLRPVCGLSIIMWGASCWGLLDWMASVRTVTHSPVSVRLALFLRSFITAKHILIEIEDILLPALFHSFRWVAAEEDGLSAIIKFIAQINAALIKPNRQLIGTWVFIVLIITMTGSFAQQKRAFQRYKICTVGWRLKYFFCGNRELPGCGFVRLTEWGPHCRYGAGKYN